MASSLLLMTLRACAGLAVFLAHSVLIPVDGCSINPTRSFGPAVVQAWRRGTHGEVTVWDDHWVFWLGPCLGAALAAQLFVFMEPHGHTLALEAATEAVAANDEEDAKHDVESAGTIEVHLSPFPAGKDI
jgi:hypothetical protein